MIFSEPDNDFIGYPKWEAGVAAQEPSEDLVVEDLMRETVKQNNVTYSGFRIEPLPQPNQQDKSLTKRYKYVPMHQIRPFNYWKDLLHGVADKDWHPTILNAQTVMGAVSLVGKGFLKGVHPDAVSNQFIQLLSSSTLLMSQKPTDHILQGRLHRRRIHHQW